MLADFISLHFEEHTDHQIAMGTIRTMKIATCKNRSLVVLVDFLQNLLLASMNTYTHMSWLAPLSSLNWDGQMMSSKVGPPDFHSTNENPNQPMLVEWLLPKCYEARWLSRISSRGKDVRRPTAPRKEEERRFSAGRRSLPVSIS